MQVGIFKEIFDLFAEVWSPNSTFGSLSAFLNALVTSMYLVQDVQSQGWRNGNSVSFDQDALLDGYFSSVLPVRWEDKLEAVFVRPSFSAEFLEVRAYFIFIQVKPYPQVISYMRYVQV